MNKIFYVRDVIGAAPYWSADYTILDAIKRFKRLSGKEPSNKASIVMFTGKNVDNITVNDLGDIEYKKEHIKTVINEYKDCKCPKNYHDMFENCRGY